MRLIWRVSLALLATLALAGCAYRPLKAPCSPDEGGTPLSYTDTPPPAMPAAFDTFDRCGPMRPI